MSSDNYSEAVREMIDRIHNLSEAEAEALGSFWSGEEDLSYIRASDPLPGIRGAVLPVVSHPELNQAWQRAEDLASEQGRADELDASIDAEHAAEHRVAHLHLNGIAESGALVTARSAVLAVGIRDLLAPADYDLLTSAWLHVLGPITAG